MIHEEPRKTRKLTEVEELHNSPSVAAFIEQDEILSRNFLLFFPSVTFRSTNVLNLRGTRRMPEYGNRIRPRSKDKNDRKIGDRNMTKGDDDRDGESFSCPQSSCPNPLVPAGGRAGFSVVKNPD